MIEDLVGIRKQVIEADKTADEIMPGATPRATNEVGEETNKIIDLTGQRLLDDDDDFDDDDVPFKGIPKANPPQRTSLPVTEVSSSLPISDSDKTAPSKSVETRKAFQGAAYNLEPKYEPVTYPKPLTKFQKISAKLKNFLGLDYFLD